MIPVTKIRIGDQRRLPPRMKVSHPKAMTIALGFACEDGIVLGADTQLTASGSHKGYACKLFADGSSTWSAAVTYAGYTSFVDSFNDRFQEEISNAEKQWTVTPALVRDVITSILRTFDASDSDSTELLCGISLAGKNQRLFKTKGTLVSEVKDHAYIGVGDSSVIRYILPLIARHGIQDAQQACLVATYLIRAAKMYIDGCGGDTDIWMLKPSGERVVWGGHTAAVEDQLAMAEYFFSEAATGLLGGTDDEKFEDAIARLVTSLKSRRTELMRFFRPLRRPNLQ